MAARRYDVFHVLRDIYPVKLSAVYIRKLAEQDRTACLLRYGCIQAKPN